MIGVMYDCLFFKCYICVIYDIVLWIDKIVLDVSGNCVFFM